MYCSLLDENLLFNENGLMLCVNNVKKLRKNALFHIHLYAVLSRQYWLQNLLP